LVFCAPSTRYSEIQILFGPEAVDGVGLPLTEASARCGDAGGEGGDAGLQQSELREVPAVERQVDDFPPRDDSPEGGA
jgi:hypothetical protein